MCVSVPTGGEVVCVRGTPGCGHQFIVLDKTVRSDTVNMYEYGVVGGYQNKTVSEQAEGADATVFFGRYR